MVKSIDKIQDAEKLLSDTARKNLDKETYEVVGNLAMAMKWVLGLPGGEHVELLLAECRAITG